MILWGRRVLAYRNGPGSRLSQSCNFKTNSEERRGGEMMAMMAIFAYVLVLGEVGMYVCKTAFHV